MVHNPLYAGLIEYKPWGISRRKGQHKAIVSPVIFQKMQNQIEGRRTAPTIADNHGPVTEDFPLKGFLTCDQSGTNLTAAWTKGRNARYPYYIFRKPSPYKGKSLNRDRLHQRVESLLASIKPQNSALQRFMLRVEAYVKNQKEQSDRIKQERMKQRDKIEKKIQHYVDLIGDATNQTLIKNFEKKIIALENEALAIEVDQITAFPENV